MLRAFVLDMYPNIKYKLNLVQHTLSSIKYPIHCVLSAVVDSSLTVVPSNTAAVINSSTTLQCSSSLGFAPMRWLVGATTLVVSNCVVSPSYIPRLSTVYNATTGQCNLVFNTVLLTDAANYQCTDGDFVNSSAYAYLTVLGEYIAL